MIRAATATAPPWRWPGANWAKRLLERLAVLRARLQSSARRLTLSRQHACQLLQQRACGGPPEWPESHPAAVIGMVSAILWGGPYCGDEISVPADACRLTRPDGSVYLRSSLTDSAGRPVFMLRLGRRTLSLPRQSDLS